MPDRGSAAKRLWALYVLPAVGGLLLFHVAPTVHGLVLAFCRATPASVEWGGLINFSRMGQSSLFWRGLANSLRFAAVSAPLTACLSFAMAVAAFRMRRAAQWLVRFAFYVPQIMAASVLTLIYTWVFNPDGLANTVLGMFGRAPVGWLSRNPIAFWSVSFVMVTQGMGPPIVTFLATMTSVDPDTYEAASLDGCGVWRQTAYITVPAIFPLFTLSLLGFLIAGLQQFAVSLWLTGGGPNYGTYTLMYGMYREITMFSDYGAGAAYALLMTLWVVGLVLMQRRLSSWFSTS